ncbi:HNH endonuclease [Acinetobacter sp. 1125_18A]|uniref:HNH endonuclease n=1 Tax=Acinetobacter sp. 1125_18A TaxID=2605959 RepID=UPI00405804F3
MLFEYNIEDIKAIQWALKTDDPWYASVTNFKNTASNIQKLNPNLLTSTYDFDTLASNLKPGETTLGDLTQDKIRTKIYLVQKHLNDLKSSKLKPFLHFRTDQRCCYCYRDQTGEFSFVLDIEHILPKSVFNDCFYDLDNLSISCKRCNMNIKKDDYSFLKSDLLSLAKKLNPSRRVYFKRKDIIHKLSFKKDYFNSSLYSIIHPNLDKYDDHIDYIKSDYKGNRLTIYKPITQKGKYTYEYFRLNEFEINSFKQAQGISIEKRNPSLLALFENILK